MPYKTIEKQAKEIESLKSEVERLRSKCEAMRKALELWDENFHRDLESDNFLGDDDHEAHRVGELALSSLDKAEA